VKVVVGIPARMGSTRFPGKPLVPILGVPMIEHVYKRCAMADNVDELFVATCDREIADVVDGFGGTHYMTDPAIPRPGLRVAEACKQRDDLADDDIVVVVQGDEPLVHPKMIEVAVSALLDDPEAQLGTLVADADEAEWADPDEVKVVVNLREDILYMTRSPVPSNTRDRYHRRLKQVAIMPFRKKFLLDFQDMAETPLEIDESVELLRAVEHGMRVKAIESPYQSVSVDTEDGRQEAEEAMRGDEFFARYAP
jgi:3-deoxy-manno-octulosonate cytidylyltransferase (CMP-KDO synthetase)